MAYYINCFKETITLLSFCFIFGLCEKYESYYHIIREENNLFNTGCYLYKTVVLYLDSYTCGGLCTRYKSCLYFVHSDQECFICLGLPDPVPTPESEALEWFGTALAPDAIVHVKYILKYVMVNVPASWYSAEQYCQALNMGLVTIETREELDEIKTFMNGYRDSSESIWTSGRRDSVQSGWYWGGNVSSKVDIFNTGYPINGGDCVILQLFERGYLINNYYCDEMLYFLCENVVM